MAAQSNASGTTVDANEIAKFSRLSAEWWDPKGKMAPLHKINPLRLTYIRDAAARKFERNVRSLNCLSGLRILDIGCGAGLLCEPLTRLGAQVIGVDPSASNIAAAKLHADKGHLSIDYRCTTVEEMANVRAPVNVTLAPKVSGRIETISAQEGDAVAAGEAGAAGGVAGAFEQQKQACDAQKKHCEPVKGWGRGPGQAKRIALHDTS